MVKVTKVKLRDPQLHGPFQDPQRSLPMFARGHISV